MTQGISGAESVEQIPGHFEFSRAATDFLQRVAAMIARDAEIVIGLS